MTKGFAQLGNLETIQFLLEKVFNLEKIVASQKEIIRGLCGKLTGANAKLNVLGDIVQFLAGNPRKLSETIGGLVAGVPNKLISTAKQIVVLGGNVFNIGRNSTVSIHTEANESNVFNIGKKCAVSLHTEACQ